jgi:addiction module HigA family antidote
MTKRHASIAPVHPGEILANDIFPALGITKPALAAALGISRQTLHQLIKCERAVTPAMALRLEAVVGSTAETWLALQTEHDLWRSRRTLDTSKLKRLRAA